MKKKIILPSLLFICLLTIDVLAQSANNYTLIEPVNRNNMQVSDNSGSPILKAEKVLWDFKAFNFGIVEYNEPVTATFQFNNTSDKPFIIASAQGSCGCTNVTYPEEPIFPGESGKITATFNSQDIGPFKKSVNILEMGANEEITLYIQGEVVWNFE